LSFIGIVLTVIADRILIGHRDYYLEMFIRKTFLEERFGFYEAKLHGIDLSFPWKTNLMMCAE
jgi:hypothetical protein